MDILEGLYLDIQTHECLERNFMYALKGTFLEALRRGVFIEALKEICTDILEDMFMET